MMLVALLSGGHILFEGVPGTGKTLLVNTFAQVVDLDFNRIQFTPDLMPGDVIGTNLFNFTRTLLAHAGSRIYTALPRG